MNEKKLPKHFYINIAYLFYALAMADRKIEIDEKRKIVAIIENNWLETVENKEIIYETLREIIKDKKTSEEAFQKFRTFVIANKEYFINDTAKKIIKASHSICQAFASKNKSELILLARIHKLLQTNEA